MNELTLLIEFESPNVGVFKAGPNEFDLEPLFNFDFVLGSKVFLH